MTDRTHTRRTFVGGLVALALLGGTAAAGPAAAAPRVAATSATGATTDLGFLTRISQSKGTTTLTLDRAVLHTGAAAKAQQRRRGLDTTSDFYVQNDNRLLRRRTVAPGVVVLGSQVLTGKPALSRVTLDRLRRSLATRPAGTSGPLFRLTLDRRGTVVKIAEVYLN